MRNILTGLLALFLVSCTATTSSIPPTVYFSSSLPTNLEVSVTRARIREIRKTGDITSGPYYTISIYFDVVVTNLNESTFTVGKNEIARLLVSKDGDNINPLYSIFNIARNPADENSIIPDTNFLSSNQSIDVNVDVPLTKDEPLTEFGEYDISLAVKGSLGYIYTPVASFKVSITQNNIEFLD
jgi:hypothetical protein